MKRSTIGFILLGVLTVVALVGLFLMPIVAQKGKYHDFSDVAIVFGISNFWNVVSNIPFLVVGILGLSKVNSFAASKTQYAIFFLGVALVAFGSGYYHFDPNNVTLVWDRLPMTVAFMALFSMIISEFVDFKLGQQLLFPMVLVGLLSVVYWVIFNDLRFYALVQYYPIFAIPIIVIFFKSSYTMSYGYWTLLLSYLIAKVLEKFDYAAHDFLNVISGHTLKHIVIAIGIYSLIHTFIKRRKTLS
jgi:hypothetical protein